MKYNKDMLKMSKTISTREAAERLGEKQYTIIRWCNRRAIKSYKKARQLRGSHWAVLESDVERILNERKEQLAL